MGASFHVPDCEENSFKSFFVWTKVSLSDANEQMSKQIFRTVQILPKKEFCAFTLIQFFSKMLQMFAHRWFHAEKRNLFGMYSFGMIINN